MPLISIIIPTYNRSTWLKEAIESCLDQTYADTEIIVIDDGSESSEARRIVSDFPKVIYQYQEHQGSGAARNAGLRFSKGGFIQFLDDDDLLSQTAIEDKMACFSNHPDAGGIYSDIYLMDKDGATIGQYYNGSKRPLPNGDIYGVLLSGNFILQHALLWKREALTKVGGFPRRSMLEDWDCILRVAESYPFYPLDQPLGYYRLHHQNISKNFEEQIKGFTETQLMVVASRRFLSVPANKRAAVLCKYGLKQWIDGDSNLGKQFLKMALEADPNHPFPYLLGFLMLFNRSVGRFLVHNAWRVRSILSRHLSSRDFFMKQSVLLTKKDPETNK